MESPEYQRAQRDVLPVPGPLSNPPLGRDPVRRVRGYLNARKTGRRVLVETVAADDGAVRLYFRVPSAREPGVIYDVFQDDGGAWLCLPCPDARKNGEPCKHVFEVFYRFSPENAPRVDPDLLHDMLRMPAGEGYEDATRRLPIPRIQYVEADPYSEPDKHGRKRPLAESTREDQARENMDSRVEELVFEVARILNGRHPFPRKAGRRSLPAGDKVAMLVLRAHHNKPYRAWVEHAAKYYADGRIAFALVRQTLQGYAQLAATTGYLLEAFGILVAVFARSTTEAIIDASGISPFRVANWRDHAAAMAAGSAVRDYRPMTEWFKMHVAIDRLSKAVIGFAVTPDHGERTGDATNFEPIFRDLAENGFDSLRHVVADNIYLTGRNVQCAHELGFELVGPLKRRKNYDAQGLVRREVQRIEEFTRANPRLASWLKRVRSVIEVIFDAVKRESPRILAIGTEKERNRKARLRAEQDRIRRLAAENGGEISEIDAARLEALENESAWAGLYISRFNEMIIRMIRQNVRRIVIHERKMNRRISLLKGHYFSQYAEYSPVTDDAADDPWANEVDVDPEDDA